VYDILGSGNARGYAVGGGEVAAGRLERSPLRGPWHSPWSGGGVFPLPEAEGFFAAVKRPKDLANLPLC